MCMCVRACAFSGTLQAMIVGNKSESNWNLKFLRGENMVQVTYPAKSLDLHPCDFSLSQTEKQNNNHKTKTKQKKNVGWTQIFSKLHREVQCFQLLTTKPRADYSTTFKKWVSRQQNCVQVKAEHSDESNKKLNPLEDLNIITTPVSKLLGRPSHGIYKKREQGRTSFPKHLMERMSNSFYHLDKL